MQEGQWQTNPNNFAWARYHYQIPQNLKLVQWVYNKIEQQHQTYTQQDP